MDDSSIVASRNVAGADIALTGAHRYTWTGDPWRAALCREEEGEELGMATADGMVSAPAAHNGHAPFQAPATREELQTYVRENGVEFLFAQFVEMHGKPNAKLVPAHHLDDMLDEGAGFAGFAAGDIGQGPHHPDMIAMPDIRSFTPLPWKPQVARFACDVQVEGEEWPYCPRTILRRQ